MRKIANENSKITHKSYEKKLRISSTTLHLHTPPHTLSVSSRRSLLHQTRCMFIIRCNRNLQGLQHGLKNVLIAKILRSHMPPYYKKRLANFYSGRQACVSYIENKSKSRMFHNDVPTLFTYTLITFSSQTSHHIFSHCLPKGPNASPTISGFLSDVGLS